MNNTDTQSSIRLLELAKKSGQDDFLLNELEAALQTLGGGDPKKLKTLLTMAASLQQAQQVSH